MIKSFLKSLTSLFGYHCSHTRKLLFDYAEGALDPQTSQKLEKHLADCPPCLDFVRTYRETKNLCCKHGHKECEIPPEVEKKLCEFIRQNMKEK